MANFNKYITNERIINFLRYIRDHEGIIVSDSLIGDELDEWKSLSEMFKKNKDGYGYFISVKKISYNTYNIEFGCQVGPTTGDGGDWVVSFDEKNNIVKCSSEGIWTS